MSQTPKSLPESIKHLSKNAVRIQDDLDRVLRNYELFKLLFELLEEKLINLDHPKATVFLELLDCFDSRSDCYLENLQTSVNELRALLGHDKAAGRKV